jgi:hypothetical protein
VKIRKLGKINAAGGAILFVIVQKKMLSEPFNFHRVSAYVANNANIVTNAALVEATISELTI